MSVEHIQIFLVKPPFLLAKNIPSTSCMCSKRGPTGNSFGHKEPPLIAMACVSHGAYVNQAPQIMVSNEAPKEKAKMIVERDQTYGFDFEPRDGSSLKTRLKQLSAF